MPSHARPRLTTKRHSCKKQKVRAPETMRETFVRVKQETGDYEGQDLIDLIYAEEHRERLVAGRFTVESVAIGDATVEMIEFASDDDDERDELDQDDAKASVTASANGAVVVDLTRSNTHGRPEAPAKANSDDGLLLEYESIYVDLAQSSSSDDYESSDDDNGMDSDAGGDADGDADGRRTHSVTNRRLFEGPRRRRVSSTLPPTTSRLLESSVPDKPTLLRQIRNEIEVMEQTKPWRFVFRCPKLPFLPTPRTDACGFLFERWDDFWRLHGHAVWERQFWKPLYDGSRESNQRKYRQWCAARAFSELADDLRERYGGNLLRAVTHAAPHSGWWYRPRRPLSLVRLRCQSLSLYALHMSRFRERWPCGRRFVRHNYDPMWCFAREGHGDGGGGDDEEDDERASGRDSDSDCDSDSDSE